MTAPAAIELTVLGSAGTLTVTSAALPEAEGGVTLWFAFDIGERLAITLTAVEARQLAEAVAEVKQEVGA